MLFRIAVVDAVLGQIRQVMAQRITIGILIAVACAVGLWTVPAVAAEYSLGTFKDWSAIRYQDNGGIVCMMWSAPKKQAGKYSQRGQPFIFVTRRKRAADRDWINFEAGYVYRSDSRLTITIGAHKIALNTSGSIAWIDALRDSRRLIQWMRGGSQMIVEGISSRGTKTTDTYSLSGVNAAHQAISEECS